MNTQTLRRCPAGRPGSILIELLAVIAVVVLLMGLLISALRQESKVASVSETEALSRALASFKDQYGDRQTSRVVLLEDGSHPVTANQGPESPAAKSKSFLIELFTELSG